jgi:hypothetical protein
VALTVVMALEAGFVDETAADHARAYLEMHEVTADYVVRQADPTGLILETAAAKASQLIIAGGYNERRFGRRGPGDVVTRLVEEWAGALFVCP